MLLNILGVLFGMFLIVKGADIMVDGASAMARKFRITEVVIGLTVVAFGTSMPEFVVSFFSALRGSGDMSVGNIMGSNIFNSLVILGATAFVATVPVKRRSLYVDIPWGFLAALVCCLVCFDAWLWGGAENMISFTDALILLVVFALFMGYNFWLALRSKKEMKVVESSMPNWEIALKLLGGLAGLILGGNLMVNCASNVARELGVSEAIIALTILAAGTSAPELVTSIVAARRGSIEMAVGNAIGSNVFNVFFVLGTAGLIAPLRVNDIQPVDVLMFLGGPLFLWIVAFLFRRINRLTGSLMVLAYVAYLVILVRTALGYPSPL